MKTWLAYSNIQPIAVKFRTKKEALEYSNLMRNRGITILIKKDSNFIVKHVK